jgi:hypothetical protein
VVHGKFKGRVTACGNNYRQFALAAAMYAGDDSKGRLPAFELPTESSQLAGVRNLYLWNIGLPMLKAMQPYGVAQAQMWYCPVRKKWQTASETFQWEFGRPMSTIDDFPKYSTEIQHTKYAFVDLNQTLVVLSPSCAWHDGRFEARQGIVSFARLDPIQVGELSKI